MKALTRLFVITARDKPIAVILRRGPARWYHVIRWDMRDETFTHGAWVKGRIYEEKCDISPDGELFVYFIHQGSRGRTPFTQAWTAVSRVPWLSALAVWPQGMTYGGGGVFVGNLRLAGPGGKTHPDFPVRGLELVDGSVDFKALTEHRAPVEKIPDADWCGQDHEGHAIFSRGGQLFRRIRGKDQMLADFSNLRPDPQPAPGWACRPLSVRFETKKQQKERKRKK
jgi:hypothetical protein